MVGSDNTASESNLEAKDFSGVSNIIEMNGMAYWTLAGLNDY